MTVALSNFNIQLKQIPDKQFNFITLKICRNCCPNDMHNTVMLYNPIQAGGGGQHNVPPTSFWLAVLKQFAVGW